MRSLGVSAKEESEPLIEVVTSQEAPTAEVVTSQEESTSQEPILKALWDEILSNPGGDEASPIKVLPAIFHAAAACMQQDAGQGMQSLTEDDKELLVKIFFKGLDLHGDDRFLPLMTRLCQVLCKSNNDELEQLLFNVWDVTSEKAHRMLLRISFRAQHHSTPNTGITQNDMQLHEWAMTFQERTVFANVLCGGLKSGVVKNGLHARAHEIVRCVAALIHLGSSPSKEEALPLAFALFRVVRSQANDVNVQRAIMAEFEGLIGKYSTTFEETIPKATSDLSSPAATDLASRLIDLSAKQPKEDGGHQKTAANILRCMHLGSFTPDTGASVARMLLRTACEVTQSQQKRRAAYQVLGYALGVEENIDEMQFGSWSSADTVARLVSNLPTVFANTKFDGNRHAKGILVLFEVLLESSPLLERAIAEGKDGFESLKPQLVSSLFVKEGRRLVAVVYRCCNDEELGKLLEDAGRDKPTQEREEVRLLLDCERKTHGRYHWYTFVMDTVLPGLDVCLDCGQLISYYMKDQKQYLSLISVGLAVNTISVVRLEYKRGNYCWAVANFFSFGVAGLVRESFHCSEIGQKTEAMIEYKANEAVESAMSFAVSLYALCRNAALHPDDFTVLLKWVSVAFSMVNLPYHAFTITQRYAFRNPECSHLHAALRTNLGLAQLFAFQFFEVASLLALFPFAFMTRPIGIFVLSGEFAGYLTICRYVTSFSLPNKARETGKDERACIMSWISLSYALLPLGWWLFLAFVVHAAGLDGAVEHAYDLGSIRWDAGRIFGFAVVTLAAILRLGFSARWLPMGYLVSNTLPQGEDSERRADEIFFTRWLASVRPIPSCIALFVTCVPWCNADDEGCILSKNMVFKERNNTMVWLIGLISTIGYVITCCQQYFWGRFYSASELEAAQPE